MIQGIFTGLFFIVISFFGVYGQTWYEVPSGVSEKLNTIEFVNASVGYIGGDEGVLLKTVDGGRTWASISYSGIEFIGDENNIINLKFVDELVGYMTVGPYSNGVYKTIDGGENWSLMDSGMDPLCYHYGLYFFEEDNGFLGGSGCFTSEQIHKITPEFEVKPIADLPLTGATVVDFDFLGTDLGLAVSGFLGESSIMRTTDGGETWLTVESGLDSDFDLTGVKIINDTLAYITYANLGEGFGLLRTTDAGLTWDYDFDGATFFYPAYHCIHQTTLGRIYVGAETELDPTGLIFSKEEGEMWVIQSVDYPIYDMSSYSGSIVWGVSENGYIVVNTPPELLSVENEKDALFKIFPNPVDDILSLHLPPFLSEHSASISIFGLDGVQHKIQYNSQSKVNVSDLAPGIYILSVKVDGTEMVQKFVKR